jgi:hypothetical protein
MRQGEYALEQDPELESAWANSCVVRLRWQVRRCFGLLTAKLAQLKCFATAEYRIVFEIGLMGRRHRQLLKQVWGLQAQSDVNLAHARMDSVVLCPCFGPDHRRPDATSAPRDWSLWSVGRQRGSTNRRFGEARKCNLWRLTFELSGHQRRDARPGPVKMYGVPPARAWWPAVGAPLERGVRHQRG